MNQRKKGERTATTGSAPKNTNTTRKDAISQVQWIKGCVAYPKAIGYTKVKNAVNG